MQPLGQCFLQPPPTRVAGMAGDLAHYVAIEQKGKEPPASSEVASVEAGGEVTFHWTDWKEFVNKVRGGGYLHQSST